MLVIGTSHGLILGFDSLQTLRWCDQEERHQGSVSALCFNHDGSRVLAGFVRGHILMLDSNNGKVLRILTDVHPLDTAVLHVKVGYKLPSILSGMKLVYRCTLLLSYLESICSITVLNHLL